MKTAAELKLEKAMELLASAVKSGLLNRVNGTDVGIWDHVATDLTDPGIVEVLCEIFEGFKDDLDFNQALRTLVMNPGREPQSR